MLCVFLIIFFGSLSGTVRNRYGTVQWYYLLRSMVFTYGSYDGTGGQGNRFINVNSFFLLFFALLVFCSSQFSVGRFCVVASMGEKCNLDSRMNVCKRMQSRQKSRDFNIMYVTHLSRIPCHRFSSVLPILFRTVVCDVRAIQKY